LSQVDETDAIPLLEEQLRETPAVLGRISDCAASQTNELGKWSVKEIIGHLVDCERVMAYRALRLARNDSTPLPGFDQDPYVAAGRFNERPLADMIAEYTHVRQATLDLVRPMSADEHGRKGTADGKSVSVRALVWIVAAHEHHHMRILQSRYL
jgi:uncharacterized damage-inducible protein DinB